MMKTIKTTLFLWVLCLFCGIAIFTIVGNKNPDYLSFSVSESANEYNFKADYNRDKAAKVEQCLDDYLKGTNDASFKRTEMDVVITLSDHTVFYIKSEPGKLRIELDKKKNSKEAFVRFRKLYEALKKALA